MPGSPREQYPVNVDFRLRGGDLGQAVDVCDKTSALQHRVHVRVR